MINNKYFYHNGFLKTSIFCIFFVITGNLFSQTDSIYSILTQTYVERPLILQRGLLQVNAGYCFNIANKEFDNNSKLLEFSECKRSLLSNNFEFNIVYGLFDFLQFSLATNYINEVSTIPDRGLVSIDNQQYVSEYNETKGLNDLNLTIYYKLPALINRMEIAVFWGLSIPTGKYNPDQPEHSIIVPQFPGGLFEVIYQYNSNPGFGALAFTSGSSVKYSTKKLLFMMDGKYNMVTKEVESIFWAHRLIEEKFEYSEIFYNYFTGSSVLFSFKGAIQIFPWFAAFGQLEYYAKTSGWTEITGQKVSTAGSMFGEAGIGYEIQVNTYIRFNQYINIPVMGKDYPAELSFYTGLRFSNILFMKKNY